MYATEVAEALPDTSDSISQYLFAEASEQAFYSGMEEIVIGLGDGSQNASDVFDRPQADLAEQDYLENFRSPSYSFDMLVDFVYNAVLAGLDIGGFGNLQIEQGHTEREAIAFALLDELGEEWTPEQFANLVNRLTSEYYATRDTATHTDFINDADASAEFALGIVAQHEQALALDQLRAFAFDPNWNPELDSQLLNQLLQATVAMPTQVLGNDVAWLQQSFIQYHNSYKQYHNWRLKLREDIKTIELQMVERQDETDRSPLWWVGIIGETLLGFFDVFDAIFTIRDGVMYNDWSGLGFLALDIALPVIGDAIMSIRRASRGLTELSDEMIDFMAKSNVPRGSSYNAVPQNIIDDLENQGIRIETNVDMQQNGRFALYPDGSASIQLPPNATAYQFFHERAHALQFLSLSDDPVDRIRLWNAIRTNQPNEDVLTTDQYLRELYVWNDLITNRQLYNLTEEQIRHANEYIIGMRIDGYLTPGGAERFTQNLLFDHIVTTLNRFEDELGIDLGLLEALDRSFDIPNQREIISEIIRRTKGL